MALARKVALLIKLNIYFFKRTRGEDPTWKFYKTEINPKIQVAGYLQRDGVCNFAYTNARLEYY
jgi:hypothetical protein